jgi:hypothetical protein
MLNAADTSPREERLIGAVARSDDGATQHSPVNLEVGREVILPDQRALTTDLPLPLVARQAGIVISQWAARPRATSRQVANMMRRSSHKLQLLIYQRSASIRSIIDSIRIVSPRKPLTCAQPVMPGLT